MHILIAPNAFKHSLDAPAAASAIRDGFLKSNLSCKCSCFPVGDGGDGTAALIVQQLKGEQVVVKVHDALGRSITSSFALVDGGATAVIEMADAAGIRLLTKEELNPLKASSFGTGEMIKAALDSGVKKIIIGMGGSATVDGGCGILQALGIRFLDSAGIELKELPSGLAALDRIDLNGMDKRILSTEVIVLCDVFNLLLGKQGAAAVFGPQKGADAAAVRKLESALSQLAVIGTALTGKPLAAVPSGGTAGGAAAGLYGFINAQLVNGIDYFLTITGFDAVLQDADLVVTGEGSLDEQTLHGKAPFGVAKRAKQMDKTVIGIAGSIPVRISDELHRYFDVLLPISNQAMALQDALPLTGANLTRTACEAGNAIAAGKSYNLRLD